VDDQLRGTEENLTRIQELRELPELHR
jgi:hypothetical protein